MDIKNKKPKRRHSFKNKKYAVLEVIEKGRHRKDLADELDIHINTLSNWIRIYKEKGLDGLRSTQASSLIDGNKNDDAELKRLREIEKKYNDQLLEIEILKKFQAFLKKNENR